MKGQLENLFKTFIVATLLIVVLAVFAVNPPLFYGSLGKIFVDPMFAVIGIGMLAIVVVALLFARSAS